MIATGRDTQLSPRSCAVGYVYAFRVGTNGLLELVHKTEMETTPTALCAFQGRLLVGVGKALRIYDLGRHRLLRKCEVLVGDHQILLGLLM